MHRQSIGLLFLVVLAILWAAYFYILLTPLSELYQMRRIFLGGFIALASGLTFTISLMQFLRCKSTSNPHKRPGLFLLTAFLMTISVATTFQMRLPDAFRHAYASAFLTYHIGSRPAQELGNLVEWVTSFKKNKLFNSGMDQCNNDSGRRIALDAKKQGLTWWEIERRIETAYKENVLILSKHQHQDILSCYKERFPRSEETILEMEKYIKLSKA